MTLNETIKAMDYDERQRHVLFEHRSAVTRVCDSQEARSMAVDLCMYNLTKHALDWPDEIELIVADGEWVDEGRASMYVVKGLYRMTDDSQRPVLA